MPQENGPVDYICTMDQAVRTVALMLGANQGQPAETFRKAMDVLGSQAGKIIACSLLYITEPWGDADQPDYINQALLLETSLGPGEFHRITVEAEHALGRIRDTGRNAPRVIDIDIMLFGDVVLQTADLVIPHPRMHLRRFNLVPLAEIAPDMKHPVFGKTVMQLLEHCRDPLKVERKS